MIIDIGGGTTDIAVISMGGIVNERIGQAGRRHFRRLYREIHPKEVPAVHWRDGRQNKLKKEMGAAFADGETPLKDSLQGKRSGEQDCLEDR